MHETFNEYNIDLEEEYVWNVLKRCKPVETSESNTN